MFECSWPLTRMVHAFLFFFPVINPQLLRLSRLVLFSYLYIVYHNFLHWDHSSRCLFLEWSCRSLRWGKNKHSVRNCRSHPEIHCTNYDYDGGNHCGNWRQNKIECNPTDYKTTSPLDDSQHSYSCSIHHYPGPWYWSICCCYCQERYNLQYKEAMQMERKIERM